MKLLHNKLKDKRGASLIMALFFFLISTVIGSIVLFSAASNAGRISHTQQEEEAYLTVSSAAKLVCDALDGVTFRAVSEVNVDTPGATPTITSKSLPGGSLSDQIGALVEGVYTSGTEQSATYDIEATDMDTVSMTITVKSDYSMLISFLLKENNEQYKLRLTVPATKNSTTGIRSEELSGLDAYGNKRYAYYAVTTTNVEWYAGTITKGDGT